MTLRQLTALLALPATARPLLYAAAAGLRSHGIRASQARSAAFSTTSVPAAKHMKTAAFSIPEYSTSTPLGLTPAQLFEHSSLSSVASGDNLEDALSDLFTRNPATFYHGNPNFYHLRKNTRIPEVCILGRSNVGKSSLVNAVANRMGSELARVSKKAGHTKTINSYGFGPAPRPEKGEVAVGAEFKGKEEMPKHMFFLVDMPGYGHGSLQEWGKNIALYLQKRTALKGAVMLIDAEVGPKDSDWTAIELMANAGLRTAIVLTKADKVKTGNEGLLKTCKTVWDGIRQIEAQLAESNKKWTWEKEFYVTATGATDATIRRATITTARLVVARLAGLVKDTRPESVAEQKWSGKIVSFDELFGDASSEATKTSPVEPALPETNVRVAPDEWEDVGEVEEESAAMEEERDALAALETRMQERRHRESAPNRMASNDAVWGSLSDRNSSSSTRPEAPIRQDSKKASKKSSSKYANESTAKYSNKSQSKSPNKSPGKPQNKPQKKPQNKSQNKPSGRKATPTPTPTAPKIPTDPFSRMLAAGRPAAGGRNQRLPKASFFHTSSTHARPTTTITTTAATTPDPESQTQPHPLTKEELDVVLAEFVATLQPSTSLRDLVRQRKLDMEMGVGQPSPEAMRQSWVERLERNKQDLAARYLHETRQIREVRDRRLAHEEEKLRRQEAMLADQRSLEGDADWVAIKREMRQLEREKKRADEAAVAAAVVESRRGEVDGEGQRDVERDEGHAEEEDGVYRRGRRPALEADEVDMPPARQGAKRSKRGKLDEFDKVFASKLGGGGGGNSGGKGDKAGKSKTSRPSF